LYEPSVERFRRAGAEPSADAGRRLLIPSSDPSIEFLVVKPGDVPVYVESGAADLGVTGTDVLRESGADVLEPLELGFGFCRLVVAAPAGAPYPSLPGGITARVATKYPRLAQSHFASVGLPVDIIQVNGSVEVAPLLGLAHWIVDLVDTGNTLRANDLVERETVLACGAVLVANRASQKLKLDAYLGLMERLERNVG
jgi:ATP phosphoribosyltransferase